METEKIVIPEPYDILSLHKMEMASIYKIAQELGVDFNCKGKQTIIYEILDKQQSLQIAQ